MYGNVTRTEGVKQYVRIQLKETDNCRLEGHVEYVVGDVEQALDFDTYHHRRVVFDDERGELAFLWGEMMDDGPQIIFKLTPSVSEEWYEELIDTAVGAIAENSRTSVINIDEIRR